MRSSFNVLILAGLAGSPFLFSSPVGGAARHMRAPGIPAIGLASSLRLALPPAAAPQPVGGFQSSVMPHTDTQCSAQLLPVSILCSTFTGVNAPCSAHCESGQICSIAAATAPSAGAACSSAGAAGGLCSVLQPPLSGADGGLCSVFDTAHDAFGTADCSVVMQVIAPGGGRQTCSAQNPGSDANFCSVSSPSAGVNARCSVLDANPGFKNVCTVGFQGGKRCSVESGGGAVKDCSVGLGTTGLCTTFKSAPRTACSAFTPQGHCSVIGGAAGGPVCRQP